MKVTQKICFHKNMLSKESEFKLGFLGHHVVVPLRFEHEPQIYLFRPFDAHELLPYILKDEIGRRA